MNWSATIRYGLEPAPGGLAFVQDLLNTISAGKPRQPDLLTTADDASEWIEHAVANWSGETNRPAPDVSLGRGDLDELRTLRRDLRLLVQSPDRGTAAPQTSAASVLASPVTLHLDEHGHIRAEPRGTGWRRVASLTLIEVFEAQRADTWRRLKVCRNHRCEAAFYDRSRNNSGVWHDVRICGNAANLRNYRARKRAASSPA
ncbi:CGNR zinc finger domain-containing protein [Streptomyces sp. NPDC001292]|uniref:CGNR zinc finger domain-containing protein n=1 Tax=Streptomyces sp. NPDC001292 TaxID=3364558 RepID=UPI003683B01D